MSSLSRPAQLARGLPDVRVAPWPGHRRGHPARPGTLPYNRGHLMRTGSGFLSPAASNVPSQCGLHPAAWNVPGRTAQGGAWWRMRYSGEGVLSLGLVVVRECIGIRRRAVARQSSKAGPMSKSDTKGFAALKRAKQNRMIPGFCCRPEEREASFVSDLDTTWSASRDLSGDAGGNSDASAASSPSEQRDPTMGAHKAGTRCDGANRATALGCPHAPPRCRPPPHRPQALRPA